MHPNPKTFPILSYVMSKLKPSTPSSSFPDIENPSSDHSSSTDAPNPIFDQMPQITDPKVLKSMTLAISDVAQTRSVLQALGDRPDHETVDKAKSKITEIESNLSKHLEEIVLSPRPSDVDRLQWRAHLSEKENEIRNLAAKEKQLYKSILQLDEMHEAYEKLLRESEEKLVRVYNDRVKDEGREEEEEESVDEDVVGILKEVEGKNVGLERVDLSGKRLRFVPEAFGKIKGLLSLNLSNNQIEVIGCNVFSWYWIVHKMFMCCVVMHMNELSASDAYE